MHGARFRASPPRYPCTTDGAAERSEPVTKLKSEFTPKQWKGCCGKGCKKCEIAQAYVGKYGRAEGLEKLNKDRDAVTETVKSGSKKGHTGKAKKKARA